MEHTHSVEFPGSCCEKEIMVIGVHLISKEGNRESVEKVWDVGSVPSVGCCTTPLPVCHREVTHSAAGQCVGPLFLLWLCLLRQHFKGQGFPVHAKPVRLLWNIVSGVMERIHHCLWITDP